MANGKEHLTEPKLKEAFASGYEHATLAFSKLIQANVQYDNFHHGSLSFDSLELIHPRYAGSDQPKILLTTEIFGEVNGKSYLYFTKEEADLITRAVPTAKGLDLKQEFLKEVDNILSASVITKLSNQLGKQMYGDIPILIEQTSASLHGLVEDDFSEIAERVYINSSRFLLEGYPRLQPLFVWVLNPIILSSNKIVSPQVL